MNERDLDESSAGLDPDLLGRFDAAARASLPELAFLAAVEARIRRERRIRVAATGAFYVALIAVAVLLTPYVAAGSSSVAAIVSEWAPRLGPVLLTPVGFGLSLLLGGAWLWRRRGVFGR